MFRNLTREVKITQFADQASTATTGSVSSAVDALGYRSVTFIRKAGAARVFTVLGSNTGATATDFVTLATPTVTTTATGQTAVLEVVKPTYRWLKLEIAAGVTAVYGDGYVLFAKGDAPVTNENAALGGVKHALAVSPTT